MEYVIDLICFLNFDIKVKEILYLYRRKYHLANELLLNMYWKIFWNWAKWLILDKVKHSLCSYHVLIRHWYMSLCASIYVEEWLVHTWQRHCCFNTCVGVVSMHSVSIQDPVIHNPPSSTTCRFLVSLFRYCFLKYPLI